MIRKVFFASISPRASARGKITCQPPGKSQTTFVFCRNCGTNFIKNGSCRWRKSSECCQRFFYSEQVSRARKDTSEVRSSCVTTITCALPPTPRLPTRLSFSTYDCETTFYLRPLMSQNRSQFGLEKSAHQKTAHNIVNRSWRCRLTYCSISWSILIMKVNKNFYGTKPLR